MQLRQASHHPPPQQQTERSGKTEKGSQSVAPSTTIVFNEPHSPKDHSETTQNKRNADDVLLNWLSDIKLTDVLLVLFTAVLAFKTSGLFQETAGLRAAADQQALDMQASIVEARRSADAAIKAAETSERALFAAYRPLITITGLELKDGTDSSHGIHIQWGLRNSGQGVGIVNSIGVTTEVHFVSGTSIERANSFNVVQWHGVIEPRELTEFNRVTTPSIREHIFDILAGRAKLFVVFELAGQDFFHNPTHQVFQFSYFALPVGGFQRVTSGMQTEERQTEGE